jgi:hypothetical protein
MDGKFYSKLFFHFFELCHALLVSKYKLLIWPIHNFFTKNSRRVFNNAVFDANFKFVDEVAKKVMGES